MRLPSPPSQRPAAIRRTPTVLVLLCPLLLIGGCGFFKDFVSDANLPLLERRGVKLDANASPPRPYPAKTPLGQSLTIEVIRQGNAIVLENRGVHAYQSVQLWLNQEFGADLGEVAVGRGVPLALQNFVNVYDERYPVGGFLNPDADRALVSADLVIDGKLHRLTVRLGDDWREP